MQTNFNSVQLADPTIARADAILRRCVHCGLCTATCPTYVLTGDERDSPRGRIYFMKQMFEEREVTPSMTYHIDRCLSCFSCMTTCPSGVDYMHLVDLARTRIEAKGHRTPRTRTLRWIVSKVLPNPRRFRLALTLGWLARPFRNLIARAGFERSAAALELLPRRIPKAPLTRPRSAIGKDPKAKRVALHARLRAGGARALDQPRRHQAAQAARRRRRGGQGRDLLRRAGAFARQGRGGARLRPAQYRRLDRGHSREAARRHRRHHLGLRHHGQGLRQSARARPRLCRARRLYFQPGARHHRVHRPDRAQSAGRCGPG